MKSEMRCPINQMQYMDEKEKQQVVVCYFSSGANKGKSKELFILAQDPGRLKRRRKQHFIPPFIHHISL